MRTRLGRLGLTTSTLVLTAGLLAGCGSSESSESSGSSSAGSEATASADPSAAAPPVGGPDTMMDADQLAKIRACLKAAGLDDELPTAPPSGMPSDMPSDRPTEPPSDLPTDLAGGGPGGFLSDEAQQALVACGIDLPSPPADQAG